MKEENLQSYVNFMQKEYGENVRPIFEIMLIQNSNKELISPSGKKLRIPDEGAIDLPGFYYDVRDCIEALHYNAGDMREGIYNAAFVLCHFPGLYDFAGRRGRIYFLWDEDRQGFFEAEEPEVFLHIAY